MDISKASVHMPAMEVATLSWELSHKTNQIKIRGENANLATANEWDPITGVSVDSWMGFSPVRPSLSHSFKSASKMRAKDCFLIHLYSPLKEACSVFQKPISVTIRIPGFKGHEKWRKHSQASPCFWPQPVVKICIIFLYILLAWCCDHHCFSESSH